LSNKVATLPAIMRKAGYATAAFTGGGPLAAEFGFGYGFDAYYEDRSPNVGDPDGTASRPFDRAIEWFSRHADEPVFLFIHVDQVRSPYVPPTGYQDLFLDERLKRPSKIDEGALVRYDREIRFVNDVFEAFVSRLDKLSSPKRTLLVLTSGNGQEFLEHGARFSGTHLYEESIRVPLMMRGLDLRAGQRYSDPVGIIDVMPTLLELASVERPSDLQGVSFGRWLRSGLPVELPARFCEARGSSRVGKDGQERPWKGPAYAVIDGDHKVIVSKAAPQLEAYDLTSDPAETTSLADSSGSPSWVARLTDVVRNYPTACRQVAKPVATPFLTPETRAKLRALGYAD
jgi:arylsulfatase A-like enzyme